MLIKILKFLIGIKILSKKIINIQNLQINYIQIICMLIKMYIYIQISRFFKGTTAKEVSSFLKLYHWVLKSTRLLLSFYKFLSEFLHSIPDGQNYFFFLFLDFVSIALVITSSLLPSTNLKAMPFICLSPGY